MMDSNLDSKRNVFSVETIYSIVIEGIRTLLFFSQKVLKRKKHKINF